MVKDIEEFNKIYKKFEKANFEEIEDWYPILDTHDESPSECWGFISADGESIISKEREKESPDDYTIFERYEIALPKPLYMKSGYCESDLLMKITELNDKDFLFKEICSGDYFIETEDEGYYLDSNNILIMDLNIPYSFIYLSNEVYDVESDSLIDLPDFITILENLFMQFNNNPKYKVEIRYCIKCLKDLIRKDETFIPSYINERIDELDKILGDDE